MTTRTWHCQKVGAACCHYKVVLTCWNIVGYSSQATLIRCLDMKLSQSEREKKTAHTREVGASIDEVLEKYNIDIIIGPGDSWLTQLAASMSESYSVQKNCANLSRLPDCGSATYNSPVQRQAYWTIGCCPRSSGSSSLPFDGCMGVLFSR